jgi:hypothetical protein
MAFLYALGEGEAKSVALLSTRRTQDLTSSNEDLLRIWEERLGDLASSAGLVSGVYKYPELDDAVIVRLTDGSGDFSYLVEKAVPLPVAAFLGLVNEEDLYCVDLPLFENQKDLARYGGALQEGLDG